MPSAQQEKQYHAIPAFLRQLREEAGMSQRDIGQKLGKPQSYVYNCETANRRVDIAEFIAWARACDYAPDVVFLRLLAKTRL